jgi:hypothetical protein
MWSRSRGGAHHAGRLFRIGSAIRFWSKLVPALARLSRTTGALQVICRDEWLAEPLHVCVEGRRSPSNRAGDAGSRAAWGASRLGIECDHASPMVRPRRRGVATLRALSVCRAFVVTYG